MGASGNRVKKHSRTLSKSNYYSKNKIIIMYNFHNISHMTLFFFSLGLSLEQLFSLLGAGHFLMFLVEPCWLPLALEVNKCQSILKVTLHGLPAAAIKSMCDQHCPPLDRYCTKKVKISSTK